MHSLRLVSLLLGGMAALPAAAVSVRTLAFELPAATVSFDIRPAEDKARSAAGLRVDVARNQFGEPFELAPGRYAARSDDFRSVAEFILPEAVGSRFLLLVLPGPDGRCSIFPIPDDIARLRPGDRFLINATGDLIAVRFGAQREVVRPHHSVRLRPPRPAPADQRIEVEMARRSGDAWVPFNSTYWPLDPQARSFVLVHPDPDTGAPRVRNLSEVPQG